MAHWKRTPGAGEQEGIHCVMVCLIVGIHPTVLEIGLQPARTQCLVNVSINPGLPWLHVQQKTRQAHVDAVVALPVVVAPMSAALPWRTLGLAMPSCRVTSTARAPRPSS